jgi:hypothetical protein
MCWLQLHVAGTFTPKQLDEVKTVYKSSIDYVTSDKPIKVFAGASLLAGACNCMQVLHASLVVALADSALSPYSSESHALYMPAIANSSFTL